MSGAGRRRIPVATPMFVGNEEKYLMDCIRSGWISSMGEYIGKFEGAVADLCGVGHAVACCNGTAALHVALSALGVEAGDEVIVPTLTYVATANAVRYCGATPVFVDSEPRTWNIDPLRIEAAITPRTRGVVVVHLFGLPVDMDPIREIARRKGLFVLEDAAEALGAEYKGRRAGSLGEAGMFSFYANKTITSGEGGMVVTNDGELAERVRRLRGQGVDPDRRYWFPMIGYNYRMTNVVAAIGYAQMERFDWHWGQRRKVVGWYREELGSFEGLSVQEVPDWAVHGNWMFNVLLPEGMKTRRDRVMKDLDDAGVETRPVFHPVHTLPPYNDGKEQVFEVAESIAPRGITLPTWAGLTREDVSHVCQSLKEALAREA